jgi:purine-binding chemotaxis protein CheW
MSEFAARNAEQIGDDSKVREGPKLAGKYMTFKLSDEEYGLEILKVRELIQLMEITRVPRTREFIRGVINLRGKVIPVIDLKMKFGMGRLVETDHTVIIVLQYEAEKRDVTMGILVDEVLEVLDIPPDQIEPSPDFGTPELESNFILGVGKAEERVILLLDIGKVLLGGESAQLSELSGSAIAE